MGPTIEQAEADGVAPDELQENEEEQGEEMLEQADAEADAEGSE